MNPNAWLALVCGISYLVGSVPSAYFITRKLSGQDIRIHGSHNVGAMNAYGIVKKARSGRVAGLALASITLADMGKGVLAIFTARWLSYLGYDPAVAITLASLFVIMGHNYPFAFRFKEGGIGLATFIGVLLALTPPALGIWGGTMLASIFLADYIIKKRWQITGLASAISVIGAQRTGRFIGLGMAFLPLYFFDFRLILPVLGPTILILIRHLTRRPAAKG
jgi:glycerol-3-phosphate acyltransferase PlsY